eukprot:30947-Pelagococcus_subviridis.AAC.6
MRGGGGRRGGREGKVSGETCDGRTRKNQGGESLRSARRCPRRRRAAIAAAGDRERGARDGRGRNDATRRDAREGGRDRRGEGGTLASRAEDARGWRRRRVRPGTASPRDR